MGLNWVAEDLLTKFRSGALMRCEATAALPAASQELDGLVIVERQAATVALVVYGTDGAGTPTRARVALTEF